MRLISHNKTEYIIYPGLVLSNYACRKSVRKIESKHCLIMKSVSGKDRKQSTVTPILVIGHGKIKGNKVYTLPKACITEDSIEFLRCIGAALVAQKLHSLEPQTNLGRYVHVC